MDTHTGVQNAAGFIPLDENGYGARRRFVEGSTDGQEEGVYGELERLRSIVDVMEGDRNNKGCLKLSLNNSAMSTIFGFVFIVIVTVTIYAFANLYRALTKRFLTEE